MTTREIDVLVVGAGPTGLTLAAQLAAYGADVRVIDTKPHPVPESRALAVQPRTLEVLRGVGNVTQRLLARGRRAVRLRLHTGARTTSVALFDLGLADTAFPFLLFVSQAETEAALVDALIDHGIGVEWNTEFTGLRPDGDRVACDARTADGNTNTVRARFVVGCDGAHSTVRNAAGIPFAGGRYPQTFLLADLDAAGLEPEAVHVWLGARGPLLFFPLGDPAPWRLVAARLPGTAPSGSPEAGDLLPSSTTAAAFDVPVGRAELQRVVDSATHGRVRLSDPAWATAFRVHHRQAVRYRSGPLFLAGDAAHIHSPAGAQGMNTGIQDAVNLGWKLALVCQERAPSWLLDSYDAERRPVGAFVLRFTDRAFTAATSSAAPLRLARTWVLPRLLPVAVRLPFGRAAVFRTLSQLGIRYVDTLGLPDGRAGSGLRRAARPRPGDRLPDAPVRDRDEIRWLQEVLTAPGFHLLLCGWSGDGHLAGARSLEERHRGLLQVHRLDRRDAAGVLVDTDGAALARLGVAGPTQLLVRPDGHVGYRSTGTDLGGVTRFLGRYLLSPGSATTDG